MPITLTNFRCAYSDTIILNDITITIENHLTLLGANGSGKSSLAKAICNLISYDGLICIDERDIKTLSLLEQAQRISYIPAKLEVYDPYITLEEFVLMGRFAHKKSYLDYSLHDKTLALKSIKLLKLEHLKNQTLHSLSSGETQLAQIAAALVAQSSIIIFDEPTANLDPHNAKVIAEHIKKLKENHQIILITHDLHLACFIDSPVGFIKDKMVTLYGREFFDDGKLEKLYGVAFSNLAVCYG
ncbi:MAG: ABC transporter ATP-binding protein [Sulfurimonadaceae bacterium]|jgi:iron complex transport system ATP-binding protein|nr:ABC transporter ATP-binding protein [Sulfurimonadaceae bacterium]